MVVKMNKLIRFNLWFFLAVVNELIMKEKLNTAGNDEGDEEGDGERRVRVWVGRASTQTPHVKVLAHAIAVGLPG